MADREHPRRPDAASTSSPGGDVAFLGDPVGNILCANDAACRSLGFTHEELLACRIEEIWCDLPERDWRRLWDRIRSERSLGFAAKLRRKDGSREPVEASASHVALAGQEYACVVARDVTARRRVEQALLESEERYRALYEDNPTMYFTVDREGIVLSVNRFGAEQLGYEVKDLVGASVLKVFHPDDIEAVKRQLADCLLHPGKVASWEFRKVRKNESQLWVREDARTVRGASGEPLVLIVCEDITDQKRMEEALRRAHDELETRVRERTADLVAANVALRAEIARREEAEARLRHERDLLHILLESLPESIYFKDAEGRHTRVSRSFARFHGLADPEDAVGKTDFDFFPATQAKAFRGDETRILQTGEGILEKTERRLAASGETRYFSTTKCPVLAPDGTVTGIVGVSRDITESRRAEEKFRALLESAPDAMVITDPNGAIVLVNARTQSLFGYDRAEILGRRFADLFPARYRGDSPMQLLAPRSGIGARVSDAPLYGLRKDGTEFPVEMSVSPIETEDGLLHASAIRDITARKELERQIADLTEQEQRRIGQDLHDSIGQQITGIAMLAASLRQNLAAKDAPEAARASELVESVRQVQVGLRTVARGLLPFELAPEGLIRALEGLVERTRALHGVECVYRGDERTPIDDSFTANHLYRIAQEAIHNAVKHGSARRVVVSMQSDERRTVLRVSDDGVGIREGMDRSEGMGIRIMQYRAGIVGATLDLESQPNRGTTVTCILDRTELSGPTPTSGEPD